MSEWQTFTGSPEQFLVLAEARHGVIVKGMSEPVPITDLQELTAYFREHGTFEFLICNPHPLEDMICQQARTGQPVWIRLPTDTYRVRFSIGKIDKLITDPESSVTIFISTEPDWNIPGAQYSFTRYGEYRVSK